MSLKGWGLALILAPFTIGLSIPIYFWYWFLKKIGKWYIRGLKIFFLMPLSIVLYVITRIVEAIIGDVKWIVSIFTGGLKNMEVPQGKSTLISIPGLSQFKIRYVVAFAGALVIDYVLFVQPLISGGIPDLSFTTFTNFFAVGLPFFLLVVFSGLINKYQGTSMTSSAKELSATGVGAGAAGAAAAAPGEAAESAVGGAADAAGAAKGATEMYQNIEVGEAAEVVGGAEAEAAGAEGILASVAGSSIVTIGGPAVIVAIGLWIFWSIVAIGISAFLLSMTWGYVSQILPVIAGPIMGAVGLGGAYANWFGESTSNSLGPQVDVAFEEEKAALGQLGARVECVFKGPQCLRQWQMNNTVRPGSEDVGERYELRVVQFGLGVNRIDTAYKEKGYTLPINFLVENTRNGIKGITAEDVMYKIAIMDNDRTYCSTNGDDGSWRNINSQGLEEGDAGYEEQNNILPGLGVTPTQSLDELNLARCELLQPSLGINRVVEMMLRYDYSSQTTLYFDAMSREHRRDEGITPSFTRSETARTPVQSYVNIQGPASYYETANGDRRAVPFTARFGFDTDAGVEYRIDPESIRIYDSGLTEPTDQCSGLKSLSEGENVYTVSKEAAQRIELRQEEGWFSSSTEPSPLRCTMEISDPNSISATGEELIMRMDANYTVRITEQMESFSVWNTQCQRIKCPIVVTKQYADNADINLTAECTGVDQRDGCSVRVPESDKIDWARRNLAKDDEGDTVKIGGGSTAELAQPYSERFVEEAKETSDWEGYITDYVENKPDKVVGTREKRPKEIISTSNSGMVAFEDQRMENTMRYQQLPGALCEEHTDYAGISNEEGLKEYLNQWVEARNRGGSSLQSYFIVADEIDCGRSIAQTITDFGGCTVKTGATLIDAIKSLDSSKFETSKDCGSNKDRVKRCSTGGENVEKGVLIESGGNLQCYGGSF